MVQLTAYGERVVDRINMIGMWIAVVVCVRNFSVCLRQYRRTHGLIHLMNIAQVVILFVHRFIFGVIPLFEIKTCSFWPLLVSLWHLNYIIIYSIMFKRLLVLESDKHSLWIRIVGIFLITLRFADWPYELAFHSLQQQIMSQYVPSGSNCLAQWGNGVIILNFIADILANIFLSGMFVRRLYIHIRNSRTVMNHRNQVIEYIARRSLICLILTFVVNLVMNLFKVTRFIENRSDVFTPYFEIIESTLLVEALRVDYTRLPEQSFCEHCGMIINSYSPNADEHNKLRQRQISQVVNNINIPLGSAPSTRSYTASTSTFTDLELPLFVTATSTNIHRQLHPLESIHSCDNDNSRINTIPNLNDTAESSSTMNRST
ncbi:MAG: hypothetical protein EXX96DRAFT_581792 [Benjaminiella poitrasii]|nr:MAG: hypothetical protein EXX96DRAFT_581792 [Benjaminiella poitrasii]